MRPLSYSQISLYQSCPLCYRLQYIDGLEPKDKWFFSFGSVLHLCAQYFYGVPVPPPPSLDQLLKFYEDNWLSEGYESGEEESKYKTYGREILTRFSKIHSVNFKLPVAVEYIFNVDIEGVKLRGFIDRADKLDSGGLSIVDYKTNKNLFTKDDLEQDLQLTLYQLAAEQIWDLPVEKLTLYHLRSNTPCSCSSRSGEQLEEAKQLVKQVADGIARGEFPAVESQYCPCDFPEYCPYYRHKYGKVMQKMAKVDILQGMAIEDAVERYVSLQSQIKALELELSELRQMVIDFCQAEGLNRVFGKEHALTYKLVERAGFNEDEVKALLEPAGLWNRVLSFDESKLKELMRSEEIGDDLKSKLESLKQIVSESPRLWVRKLMEEE